MRASLRRKFFPSDLILLFVNGHNMFDCHLPTQLNQTRTLLEDRKNMLLTVSSITISRIQFIFLCPIPNCHVDCFLSSLISHQQLPGGLFPPSQQRLRSRRHFFHKSNILSGEGQRGGKMVTLLISNDCSFLTDHTGWGGERVVGRGRGGGGLRQDEESGWGEDFYLFLSKNQP